MEAQKVIKGINILIEKAIKTCPEDINYSGYCCILKHAKQLFKEILDFEATKYLLKRSLEIAPPDINGSQSYFYVRRAIELIDFYLSHRHI